VAMAAGKHLIEGLEARKFSYVPDEPADRCEKYHRLNRAMLDSLIEKEIPDLVVCDNTGIDSYRKSPASRTEEFFDLLQKHYVKIEAVNYEKRSNQYMYVFQKRRQ